MKFVGRLGNDVVAKFTEELSLLCNEALHHNLDVMAGLPELNLVLAAAKGDATRVRDETTAASNEAGIQAHVAIILQQHLIILDCLLANQQHQILTDLHTGRRAIIVTQVSKTVDETYQDSTLL